MSWLGIEPKLDGSFRKGDHGKVLVVGGSLEYTGAPYFAAMAAMRAVLNRADVCRS